MTAVTASGTVSYPEMFPGATLRFVNQRTRLKEELVLSQKARDLLPGPAEYGIAPENAYLMLAAEFKLTPNTLKVRARKPDRRTEPVKRGPRFAFEGTDPR